MRQFRLALIVSLVLVLVLIGPLGAFWLSMTFTMPTQQNGLRWPPVEP